MRSVGTLIFERPRPLSRQRRANHLYTLICEEPEIVSRAWFFLACVLLVIVWAPTFALMTVDTWQLVINTITTIITFLLVALLQNTQRRSDDAIQHKLNAIADALADLMHHQGDENDGIRDDEKELREAVGLEERESTG
ncbi:low affinity iron permease family protein [Mycobacterium sp. SMC-16]|uniref:low affinity iron permease family protein n=1 Tax=Mycobacterium sp. SMC-16 TaxID=3385967 RepID=UPI00390C8321